MLQLAGDSDQLRANGQTWKNISATLRAAAHNIEQDVRASFPDGSFTGSTASSYVTASSATTAGIAMAGTLSGAVGTAYDVCAVIIQFVHDFVRDAISQVVGSILSYAVELVASFGTAFPLVMEQISTRVASLMGGVSKRHHRPEGIPVEPGRSADQRRPAPQVAQEWLHNLTHADAPTARTDGAGPAQGLDGERRPHAETSAEHPPQRETCRRGHTPTRAIRRATTESNFHQETGLVSMSNGWSRL